MTDDLGNTLYGRRTYFPNVNTGAGDLQFRQAPGVAEGQARMDQLAATGTYRSRRDDFRNKYPQFVNPSAQRNLQQFDINQSYAQGYGAPNPTIQQGPGGPYRIAGGVVSPFTPRNAFQTLGSNLAAGTGVIGRGLGTLAANAFSWLSSQNELANRDMSGMTNPRNQTFYAYNPSPSSQYANPGENATPGATPNTGPDSQYFAYNPSPLQPRRFDFNYF